MKLYSIGFYNELSSYRQFHKMEGHCIGWNIILIVRNLEYIFLQLREIPRKFRYSKWSISRKSRNLSHSLFGSKFVVKYRLKRFGNVVLQFHPHSKIYHMSRLVDTLNPIQPISCSVSRIIRISVDQDSISSIFNFLTASQNNPLGQGQMPLTKNGLVS